LSLGDSTKVAVGDEIYVIGNPQGLEGTFSQGIVSSIRKIGTDTLLQITAPISPGSSGGPVLDSKGEVIGVAVATFKGGQNLNFAIPVSYLSTLLSNIKPAIPLLGEVRSTQNKSILDGLGGRSTEGVAGGAFVWKMETAFAEIFGAEYSFSLSLYSTPVGILSKRACL
jgi:S1-C subfamily serine protease